MNEFKNTLDLYIKEGKVNHSYMIETDSKNRKDVANLVIQEIIDKTNKNVSVDELQLNGDLIYIETDLQTIKKEEIIELKERLNTSSIYSGIRVYVILESEKLNSSKMSFSRLRGSGISSIYCCLICIPPLSNIAMFLK